jgi:hypothetical protein
LPDGAVVLFGLACDGVEPGDFIAAAGDVFLDDIPLLQICGLFDFVFLILRGPEAEFDGGEQVGF